MFSMMFSSSGYFIGHSTRWCVFKTLYIAIFFENLKLKDDKQNKFTPKDKLNTQNILPLVRNFVLRHGWLT